MEDKRYCFCRSKDGEGKMIQCERCEEWYHFPCVKMTKSHSNSIDKYYCSACLEIQPDLKVIYKKGCGPPSEKRRDTIKQEPLEARQQEKKLPERSRPTLTNNKPRPTKSKPASTNKPKASQRKGKDSQKTKSKLSTDEKDEFRCANPECILEPRSDSKYCSDQCGYEFNKKRYETFFIPKWQILEKNHSQARLKKMKDLDQLEKDKVEVEQKIEELKEEKKELETNIRLIKEEAKKLCKENENLKDIDDEDMEAESEDVEDILTGDASKTFCITCGLTIASDKALKHWSSCHKKHEATYNFTADVMVNYNEKEDLELYCNILDKKSKRYCMHIKSACPQHSNWSGEKDEVCGCPLNIMQTLVPDGHYCLELKRDCGLHYHWDKFRLAQMNMDRVHAYTRLDLIRDRIRIASANLADTYGGVVGVMLHNTVDHQDDLDYKNEIDVEMAAD